MSLCHSIPPRVIFNTFILDDEQQFVCCLDESDPNDFKKALTRTMHGLDFSKELTGSKSHARQSFYVERAMICYTELSNTKIMSTTPHQLIEMSDFKSTF